MNGLVTIERVRDLAFQSDSIADVERRPRLSEVKKFGRQPTLDLMRNATRRPPLTFRQYLTFRLGSRGGGSAWFNFFIKPFAVGSFAEFWRLWNPVYGYFLYWFSYRPLGRVLPRAWAMLITFVARGFLLHDLPAWLLTWRVLPPGATIAFFMFGTGAIRGELTHMDLSRRPVWTRATINVGYLAGCILAMLLIVFRWR